MPRLLTLLNIQGVLICITYRFLFRLALKEARFTLTHFAESDMISLVSAFAPSTTSENTKPHFQTGRPLKARLSDSCLDTEYLHTETTGFSARDMIVDRQGVLIRR